MKTWTALLSQYQTLTKNTTAENQSLGGININDSIRTIASIRNGKWKWLETVETLRTIAGKQNYSVPNKIRKIVEMYVQVGESNTSMVYPINIVYDPKQWTWVLASKLGDATYPRWVYVQDDTMLFSPIPSQDDNIIFIRGRLDLKDLSIADYTTGTISAVPYRVTLTVAPSAGDTTATLTGNWTLPTDEYEMTFSSGEVREVTLTNGSTAVTWDNALADAATTSVVVSSSTGGSIVTGAGTTWTVPMAGRYIRITDSSTANTGDGFWYKIAEVINATTLVLEKGYQGTAIVAGTATYTIGQCSPIPEAYDVAPLWRAVAIYWDIQGDTKQSERYWRLYDGGYEAGISDSVGGLLGQMAEESGATVEGSYISPQDIYYRQDPNNPEPNVPQSSF